MLLVMGIWRKQDSRIRVSVRKSRCSSDGTFWLHSLRQQAKAAVSGRTRGPPRAECDRLGLFRLKLLGRGCFEWTVLPAELGQV